MSSTTIVTKFGITDFAYVLSEARDKGLLARGHILYIQAEVGIDGSRTPSIFYRMDNNAVFAPPEKLWAEYELGTEAEARALARQYHALRAAYHESRSEGLQ